MSGPDDWPDVDRPAVPLAIEVDPSEALEIQMSESCGELFAALALAQTQLTNPVKGKTAKAGQYSYDYADIADVLEGARPILASYGIATIQIPLRGRGRELALVTILAHTSGQYLRATLRWEVGDSKVQSLGGAITYLRRYALQSMIGVAADADLDGDAPGTADKVYGPRQKTNGQTPAAPPPPPAPKGPSPAEMKAEMAELKKLLGGTFDEVLFDIGLKNEAGIKTLTDAKRALTALRAAADLRKHKESLAGESSLPEGLFPPSEQRPGANYPD